ncbi:unknown [Alistipes sp. CAG:514]|nr:unknown [Alistipes sp. CAG:514]
MKKISIIIKLDERSCTECKDAHQPVFVRGHFRMVRGKKVYVKAHYRKR